MMFIILAGLICTTSNVNPGIFCSKCFKVSPFILLSTTIWQINVGTALVPAKRLSAR